MFEVNFTLVKRRVGPWVQFAIALATGLLGMLVCKIAGAEAGREYFAAMVGITFFTIINTVISIGYKSYLRYTLPSYYIYILLIVILLLSAKFLSGISIWKLQEYRNMLLSVTIFYAVVSVLVRIVRFIFDMVEDGF
jgi:hypothetical protein